MSVTVNDSVAGGGGSGSSGTVSNGLLVFSNGGNDYAALPVTPGGDVSANIIPRTGTLSTLLSVTGGNGEVAAATDIDALVKYTGVAGGAAPFYNQGYRMVNVDTDVDEVNGTFKTTHKTNSFIIRETTGSRTLNTFQFTTNPTVPFGIVTIINTLDYFFTVAMETPGPNITVDGFVAPNSVVVLEWFEEAPGEFTLRTKTTTSCTEYTGFPSGPARKSFQVTCSPLFSTLETDKLATVVGSCSANTVIKDQTALFGNDPRAAFPGAVGLRSSVVAETNRNFLVLAADSTAASTTYTLTATATAPVDGTNNWLITGGVHRFKLDIVGVNAAENAFCRFEREVLVVGSTLVTPTTTGLASDVFSGTFFTGSTVTIDIVSGVLRVRVTTGTNATSAAFWTCFADHVVAHGTTYDNL